MAYTTKKTVRKKVSRKKLPQCATCKYMQSLESAEADAWRAEAGAKRCTHPDVAGWPAGALGDELPEWCPLR